MQKVAQMGTMYQKLLQYMQLALTLAQATDPMAAESIGADIVQTMGGKAPMGVGSVQMTQSDNIAGIQPKEHGIVTNARSRAQQVSQPDGGSVTEKEGK